MRSGTSHFDRPPACRHVRPRDLDAVQASASWSIQHAHRLLLTIVNALVYLSGRRAHRVSWHLRVERAVHAKPKRCCIRFLETQSYSAA